MAGRSILPFNNITINGTDYGASGTGAAEHVMVAGSGEYTTDPVEITTTTNDGTIHVDMVCKNFTARCELYGDFTALNTSVNDQDKIEMLGATLYGVTSADYSKDSETTKISCTGKISASPEPLLEQVILDGGTGESS